MKKRLAKKLCPILALFFIVSCFFMLKQDVWADADSDSEVALAPTITSCIVNRKDDSVTLQWKMPENLDCYRVDIYSSRTGDKSGEWEHEQCVYDGESSYTDSYISKGVPYFYKIVGTYFDEDSFEYKETEPAYTDQCISPLSVPSLINASAGNSHSISIKWKASDDDECEGYQVFRSESPNGTYKLVQTVSNSFNSWWDYYYNREKTYTQKNLEFGKIYYYKIRPYTVYEDVNYYGNFSNYKFAQVTINGTKIKSASSKKIKTNTLTWAKNNEADGYMLSYSKTRNGKYTKLKTYTNRNNLSYTHTKLTNGTAYYYKIEAYKNYKGKKLIGPTTVYQKYCDYYTYKNESYESKCKRVFGREYYNKYSSAKEAKKHMTTITVKVWDQKGKKKFTRKFRLTVNKKLAPSIKQMFYEIYKSKERFPIHDIGCYSWRGNKSNSEHCLGLAFDINPDENYMIDNGKILAGSFWKPKKNRYSIPLNCQLVKILEKYGFERGLWGSRRDYMHFSYFGS